MNRFSSTNLWLFHIRFPWHPALAAVFLLCLFFCGSAGCNRTEQIPQITGAYQPNKNRSVTFNKDIAPIIYDKCIGCHRPGQTGPFSLVTYKDIAKRAKTIDAVIDSGYMPPWKPVNHEIEFTNDRRLSKAQKQKLKDWIAAGKPKGEGDPPDPPKFSDGWTLGKPDVVVEMRKGFEVPATGKDVYRSFVFPLALKEDKWVKAIEYRPTATSAVHHAIFFSDPTGNARKMDGSDGKAGIEGMGFLALGGDAAQTADSGRGGFFRNFKSGQNQQGASRSNAAIAGLGGYVPGSTPSRLPGDLALPLPAGSDIVMQTHFHPSGKAETEKGKLAIYFGDKEPSQKIVDIQVPALFSIGKGLKVPAGEAHYKIQESYTLPTDIKLISVGAHAHYICREVTMTAKLPDGKKKDLLKIDDWDLDWQDRYYFKKPIVLPAGTEISTELVYDNSANNPENPNSPPKEIRWGRQSGDEMGSASLQVIAAEESDRPELESNIRRYVVQSLTQGNFVDLLMQLDTNRDGGLQRDEAPPGMLRRFDMLDRNGDGKVVPKELQILERFSGLRRN